ncbi:MAG TPA: DUF1684 domain-containing protein, partial [Ilumatobacteraceae bacterium]
MAATSTATRTALEVADWRRSVFALYAAIRAAADPADGHQLWKDGRDALFANHPASPLLAADRSSFTGLPIAAYDPAWRFEASVEPATAPVHLDIATGTDGVAPFDLLGRVR